MVTTSPHGRILRLKKGETLSSLGKRQDLEYQTQIRKKLEYLKKKKGSFEESVKTMRAKEKKEKWEYKKEKLKALKKKLLKIRLHKIRLKKTSRKQKAQAYYKASKLAGYATKSKKKKYKI